MARQPIGRRPHNPVKLPISGRVGPLGLPSLLSPVCVWGKKWAVPARLAIFLGGQGLRPCLRPAVKSLGSSLQSGSLLAPVVCVVSINNTVKRRPD